MSNKAPSFLGTGWSFPPSFNRITNRVETVSAEQDIHESLTILMGTILGERFLQPDYGTDLQEYVFSDLDTTDETEIKKMLKAAVLNGEPRITLEQINFHPLELTGRLNIELIYTIITTNTRNNFVFPYYTREATLIHPPGTSTS